MRKWGASRTGREKNERMREWENERMREWENEGMREWENERMREWENERMREWGNVEDWGVRKITEENRRGLRRVLMKKGY